MKKENTSISTEIKTKAGAAKAKLVIKVNQAKRWVVDHRKQITVCAIAFFGAAATYELSKQRGIESADDICDDNDPEFAEDTCNEEIFANNFDPIIEINHYHFANEDGYMQQQAHIDSYIRPLPEGQRASDEARERAENDGIELSDDETYVQSHNKMIWHCAV